MVMEASPLVVMGLDMGSMGKLKKGEGMQDSRRGLGDWLENTSPFFFFFSRMK